jgi:hypothetical protein
MQSTKGEEVSPYEVLSDRLSFDLAMTCRALKRLRGKANVAVRLLTMRLNTSGVSALQLKRGRNHEEHKDWIESDSQHGSHSGGSGHAMDGIDACFDGPNRDHRCGRHSG